VLRQCDAHGVDHRTPMNLTPLMAAAAVGNLPLIDALQARGADAGAVDHMGRAALHWALAAAFADPHYAAGSLAAVYARVAPGFTDLYVDERLVRLQPHQSEYLVWHTLLTLFKASFGDRFWRAAAGFDTGMILAAWEALPPTVLPARRKARAHLSNVLSRNEVTRDYAYNRKLFKRIAHGYYQLNPQLRVRRAPDDAQGEVQDDLPSAAQLSAQGWTSVLAALNLPLARETALPRHWPVIDALLAEAGVPVQAPPLATPLRDSLARSDHWDWSNPLIVGALPTADDAGA
jgi:hypothetical protein